MKKYSISIEEVISKEFEIEAESKENAIYKAIEKYKSCEFVLCPGNIESKKISLLEDDEFKYWIEF